MSDEEFAREVAVGIATSLRDEPLVWTHRLSRWVRPIPERSAFVHDWGPKFGLDFMGDVGSILRARPGSEAEGVLRAAIRDWMRLDEKLNTAR